MVLVSEAVAAITTFFAVTAVFPDEISILPKRWKMRWRISNGTNVMPVAYCAVRLLLETETKQSVGPVYLAAVMLIVLNTPKGKRPWMYWMLRYCSAFLNVCVILIYLCLTGLRDVANSAAERPLDREMVWYQMLLAQFVSYRWLLILVLTQLPVIAVPAKTKFMKFLFLPALVVRISFMWFIVKGTGRAATSSPLVVFDELLLDSTDLLNLTLALITFNMIVDHAVEYARGADDLEKIDWEEFIRDVHDFSKIREWLNSKRHEASLPLQEDGDHNAAEIKQNAPTQGGGQK